MSLITNSQELINNSPSKLNAQARRVTLTLLEAAISAVDPKALIQATIQLQQDTLYVQDKLQIDLNQYSKILAIGGGKASGAMAETIEEILGARISAGLINVPENSAHKFKVHTIELNEAGHPIPNEAGQDGAQRIVEYLNTIDAETLVIFLLSGGGSALLPLPQKDITLDEMKIVTDLLLRSGANIDEINVVRKHLSRIKGGRLAVASYPATLLCLILSDVIGDPLSSIASGPTVPDPSTYHDAVHILKTYEIWSQTPASIRTFLEKGLTGQNPESPKAGDHRFSRVQNVILGNNSIALAAAEEKAKQMGFTPLVLTSYIRGEARHVGTVLASIARELMILDKPVPKPAVILAGGEPTVTVTGRGRGGRNNELVLSACLSLYDLDGVVLASVGTDGIDGMSDSAGALADGLTLTRAKDMELNPMDYLQNNDSHHFFKGLQDLIYTGPTGTNVNDIIVIVGLTNNVRF